MIDVILVRHAESEANALGIVNGDPSIPYALTDTGRRQAAELGHALSDEMIDLCVVTEFARARETADVALAGRHIPRMTVSELGDPAFGILEGLEAYLRRHRLESIDDVVGSLRFPEGEAPAEPRP